MPHRRRFRLVHEPAGLIEETFGFVHETKCPIDDVFSSFTNRQGSSRRLWGSFANP